MAQSKQKYTNLLLSFEGRLVTPRLFGRID